jgi:hypothetical protein
MVGKMPKNVRAAAVLLRHYLAHCQTDSCWRSRKPGAAPDRVEPFLPRRARWAKWASQVLSPKLSEPLEQLILREILVKSTKRTDATSLIRKEIAVISGWRESNASRRVRDKRADTFKANQCFL